MNKTHESQLKIVNVPLLSTNHQDLQINWSTGRLHPSGIVPSDAYYNECLIQLFPHPTYYYQ